MSAQSPENREYFPSPPNLPPASGWFGRLRPVLRQVLDLQVRSVLRTLVPWLARQQGKMLEVGCGAQPYRHRVPASCRYFCLDWAHVSTQFGYRAPETILYDGHRFPFRDGAFQAVFHTEVLEHVWDVPALLRECRRVLDPRTGRLFFSVPFQARYHYIPYDYWRFTPASLTRLLEEAGFREIEIRPRGTDVTVAAYKGVSLIYRWMLSGTPSGALLAVLALPLMPPLLLAGHLSLFLQLGSPDDCLGYTVQAHV
ncbi:MAG: methyltransferase domain-containing protein [Magnetococcales bacterium]|nr:methyltransferase domain-containing protein [Magnetococcales bacterium]